MAIAVTKVGLVPPETSLPEVPKYPRKGSPQKRFQEHVKKLNLDPFSTVQLIENTWCCNR